MAQHDYTIANQSGAAFRADLNNALAAIVSQNSGAAEPSVTYAYQPWADTTTGLFKIRNAANNAWITLYQLDGEWSTIKLENGTAAAPSIYFKDSGTDTGVYSPGVDQVGIATAGVQRVNFNGSTEVVFNDGGNDVDFRIEGDTKPNLFKVDAGTDTVSIDGITYPSADGTSGQAIVTNGSGILSFATAGAPTGTIIWYAANTAPTGYLKANGANVSRTTYAALFAAIGTTFGAGNGSTTFTLPDLRGEFIRGWDDGRGLDSGRSFASVQGQSYQSHSHGMDAAGNHNHSVNASLYGDGGSGSAYFINPNDGFNVNIGWSTGTAGSHTHGVQTSGGTETRPRNIALLACIKY
jgi:microcystin-dependent protein